LFILLCVIRLQKTPLWLSIYIVLTRCTLVLVKWLQQTSLGLSIHIVLTRCTLVLVRWLQQTSLGLSIQNVNTLYPGAGEVATAKTTRGQYTKNDNTVY